MTNLNQDAQTQNYQTKNYREPKISHYSNLNRRQSKHQIDRSSYVNIDNLKNGDENSLVENEQHLEQSYERDSRWKPHLSWSYLSWSLQQRMEEQAIRREQSWQKIADKLGPLLMSDRSCNFGQNDFDARYLDDRAYENVPFFSQNHENHQGQRLVSGQLQQHINQCRSVTQNDLPKYDDGFTLNGRCDYDSELPSSDPSFLDSDSCKDKLVAKTPEIYSMKQNSVSDYGGLDSSSLVSSKVGLSDKFSNISNQSVNDKNSSDPKILNYSFVGYNHTATITKDDYDEESGYYEHHKEARKRFVKVSCTLGSLVILLIVITILMALGILHR